VSPQQKKPKVKPHSLQSVARRELSIELDKEHQTANWGGELSPAMLKYAAMDTQVLLPLAKIFESEVVDTGLQTALEIEYRALPAMAWMANAGLPFNVEGWRRALEDLKEVKHQLIQQLNQLAPDRPGDKAWNWNSSKQIIEAFALAGVDLPNTQEKTLARTDGPLAKTLLKYKKISTTLSNYGPKLLESVRTDGRVYANWHQIGAETGRMACSKPGLQQLPPKVKEYVSAPEGRTLVRADYAQAEVRILAKTSGETVLIDAFNVGHDPYVAAASGMFDVSEAEVTKEQRSTAKGVVLSLIYGTTARGLAARLSIDEETSRDHMDTFFEAHPKVESYLDSIAAQALDTGVVRTLTGRIRRFGGTAAMSRSARRTAIREAKNFPMQGSCADGLKLALAFLWERRAECPGAVPVACVHDEIVVECDEAEAEKVERWLQTAMVGGMDEILNGPNVKGPHVPVEVETQIGKTWAG
jgi:DNA polymerase I